MFCNFSYFYHIFKYFRISYPIYIYISVSVYMCEFSYIYIYICIMLLFKYVYIRSSDSLQCFFKLSNISSCFLELDGDE